MTNFADILDQPFEEASRPKPLPVGTYLTVIQGLPRYDKSAKKGTPFVEFTHKIIGAADDVDTTALEESGGIGERTMKNTYYLTDEALWRLDEFLGHCGFDLVALKGKASRRQMCEQAANAEVYVIIRHEPSQDGKTVFARINGTAAA